MATITQQEVAPLHKQLHVTLEKEDYLPNFEKAIKQHSKQANIPGFRKGMVPAGLVKKMYGASLFVDEVLKQVDQQMNAFLQKEQPNIFANPIPVKVDIAQLDMHNPGTYEFTFEMGLKPDFQLPDLASFPVKRYEVTIDDAMIDEEIDRLRGRYGNMTEPGEVSSDENVLNVNFTETDASGNEIEGGVTKDNSVLVRYFKENFRHKLMGKKAGDTLLVAFDEAFGGQEAQWILQDLGIDSGSDRFFRLDITKVGLIEKRELNEEFFAQIFPNDNIKTEEELRSRLRTELEGQWATESRNQLHHSLYHVLLDNTRFDFPEAFLLRWLQTQGEGGMKTEEEAAAEFPQFKNQLKWSLITDKIATDANIQVEQEDLRAFAKQQLLGYMGGQTLDTEAEWVNDYVNRMMKDKKYVEDAYNRIQTEKIFQWLEANSKATPEPITRDAFVEMNQKHNHAHH